MQSNRSAPCAVVLATVPVVVLPLELLPWEAAIIVAELAM